MISVDRSKLLTRATDVSFGSISAVERPRWRRGMAAIPLVNPSELSSGMGGHPRLGGMAAGENRPGDTRELIGERDRQQVAMQAPGCRLDPRPETAPGGRWSPH